MKCKYSNNFKFIFFTFSLNLTQLFISQHFIRSNNKTKTKLNTFKLKVSVNHTNSDILMHFDA